MAKDTFKPLTPGSFKKSWGKGLSPIRHRDLELRPEFVHDDWEFLGACGLPSLYYVDGICTRFSGTLRPLHDVSYDQTVVKEHFERSKFPMLWHSLWHIADVDHCGSEAWLCIQELSGNVVQVFPQYSRDLELIASDLQQFYKCMLEIKKWYMEFKGSMKKGSSVIALCRILHRPHFEPWPTKRFWMPRVEEILSGDFDFDDGYPDNVSIRFQ